MADPEHLAKLREGVKAWNRWRKDEPYIEIDLSDADLDYVKLSKADLRGADLNRASLVDADLRGARFCKPNLRDKRPFIRSNSPAMLDGANLIGADLRRADLRGVELNETDLRMANLRGANLEKAQLCGADLGQADLRKANLRGANLIRSTLVETRFEGANLTACYVYGISAWDLELNGAIQLNLIVTPPDQPVIQVDNLEVAQFVYLLLKNERIRQVIDTITAKVVLILGRFTPERKAVLDAIRDELRKRDYLPILFDFQKPDSKSLTGTVQTLANMARFIIADLTDPSCIPYELATVVPHTKVPVQTIILDGKHEFAMFNDLLDYRWVLPPYRYQSEEMLLASLNERVIAPAEAKVVEHRGR